jgi:hypothetical protein
MPSSASCAGPSVLSQDSSTASVTSGWNCSPSARPCTNAWLARAVRASTGTCAGSVNRSKCHDSHGPESMSPGALELTDSQPTSGIGARSTRPPTAAASTCPPKQIPSGGTPTEISERA